MFQYAVAKRLLIAPIVCATLLIGCAGTNTTSTAVPSSQAASHARHISDAEMTPPPPNFPPPPDPCTLTAGMGNPCGQPTNPPIAPPFIWSDGPHAGQPCMTPGNVDNNSLVYAVCIINPDYVPEPKEQPIQYPSGLSNRPQPQCGFLTVNPDPHQCYRSFTWVP
jgi:hypothetical protein